jgi:hypothetical protein
LCGIQLNIQIHLRISALGGIVLDFLDEEIKFIRLLYWSENKYPTDKLAAISSIVKEIKRYLPRLEYTARL